MAHTTHDAPYKSHPHPPKVYPQPPLTASIPHASTSLSPHACKRSTQNKYTPNDPRVSAISNPSLHQPRSPLLQGKRRTQEEPTQHLLHRARKKERKKNKRRSDVSVAHTSRAWDHRSTRVHMLEDSYDHETKPWIVKVTQPCALIFPEC